jgi:hypothetical protein
MVQKSAMCGVEILFAVSAATTLAVEVAERCNLTLVGFCKPGRATIYTHPQRLIGVNLYSIILNKTTNPPLLVDEDVAYYLSHQGRRLIQTTKLKGLYHEKHQNFCRSYRSGYFFRFFRTQTVTATASTIDGAEAKIAAQAEQAGASSYKITQPTPVIACT